MRAPPVAAAALMLVLDNASCFVLSSRSTTGRHGTFGLHQLQATVYYPDDSSSSSYFEEDTAYNNIFAQDNDSAVYNNIFASNEIPFSFQQLFEQETGLLARLAVAFSPQHLDLINIEHVDVLEVDGNHMDVQAIVCEEDGCVSLKVPLSFPHPCGSDHMEECILENMHELDTQAESSNKNAAEWVEGNFLSNVFEVPEVLSLPEWWLEADYRDADECDDLIQLLNQADFATDLLALGNAALYNSGQERYLQVEHAKVMAVGPAGVHLLLSGSDETLQVSHAFDQACADMESLRTAVVDAITQAVNNANNGHVVQAVDAEEPVVQATNQIDESVTQAVYSEEPSIAQATQEPNLLEIQQETAFTQVINGNANELIVQTNVKNEPVVQALDENESVMNGNEAVVNLKTMQKESAAWVLSHANEEPQVLHLPEWWVVSSEANECHDLVKLLNQDDFNRNVLALAKRALQKSRNEGSFKLHRAKVMAVGPAGIHFSLNNANGKRLQVSFKFDEVCTDMESLRNAVVQAFEKESTPSETTRGVLALANAEPQVLYLPEWWIVPSFDAANECKELQRLLNQDDYKNDRLALGQVALQKSGKDNVNIENAKVMAVGPAGIHLSLNNANGKRLQVSYHFEQACKDTESLRNAVVDAVAKAGQES